MDLGWYCSSGKSPKSKSSLLCVCVCSLAAGICWRFHSTEWCKILFLKASTVLHGPARSRYQECFSAHVVVVMSMVSDPKPTSVCLLSSFMYTRRFPVGEIKCAHLIRNNWLTSVPLSLFSQDCVLSPVCSVLYPCLDREGYKSCVMCLLIEVYVIWDSDHAGISLVFFSYTSLCRLKE